MKLLKENNYLGILTIKGYLVLIAKIAMLFAIVSILMYFYRGPSVKSVPSTTVLREEAIENKTLRMVLTAIDELNKNKKSIPQNSSDINMKVQLTYFGETEYGPVLTVSDMSSTILITDIINRLKKSHLLISLAKYPVPIPLAYQEDKNGLYRTIYNNTIIWMPTEQEMDAFRLEIDKNANFDTEEERFLLDRFRFSKNIKLRTREELQNDIETAISEIDK
jgi:hypothetical protein